MKKKVPLDKSKIGEKNDPDGIMEALLSQNPEFELDEDQYESLRTAYGYLIHTHNRPDLSKCIFFIDAIVILVMQKEEMENTYHEIN